MRIAIALCVVVLSSISWADDEIRDAKTANPFILLHPSLSKKPRKRTMLQLRKMSLMAPFH